MATKLKCARMLVYSAAERKEHHEPYGVDAAMAKLYASEIALEVTNDAVQIFGGTGFLKGMDVERMYRDAKITTIYEGTSEVQRMVIGAAIMGKPPKREGGSSSAAKKPAPITGVRKGLIIKEGDAKARVDALVAALKKDGYDFSVGIPMDTPIAQAELFGSPIHASAMAKFDVGAILTIMPIALAAMMEHIGDMSAISATVGENFIEEPGLHRTLIGDGIATSLSAIFGGPANTTYGENTGVLVLSKVYDPRVIRLAAVYALVLSFSPMFAAVVNSMPAAIVGGVSFILYGMISAIGVRNVVENRVDFTNSRNLIIAAVILVCGLGFSGGLTFEVGGTHITLTALAVAAIAGIALNAILPGKDYEFGSDVTQGRSGDFGRY